MTRREFAVAGVSAAAAVLVVLAVVALVWPDSARPAGAGTNPAPTTPSIRPAPTLPTLDPDETSAPEPPRPMTIAVARTAATGQRPAADRCRTGRAGQAAGQFAGQLPGADGPSRRCGRPDRGAPERHPGTTISLADGTYGGSFVATSGTAQQPIFLCGGPGAVLDGGNIKGDYGFHLDNAKYWRLVGFTVTGAQKGIVADGTASVIQNLTVHDIGDEAIHLRAGSTDSVVLGNTISRPACGATSSARACTSAARSATGAC